METEIWKDIPEYEGIYEISNFGRVKSLSILVNGKRISRCKILKNKNNGNGYLIVSLTKDGKPKNKYVHILVGKCFIPNPSNKPQINHKDGIKCNNNYSNLEWVTQSENNIHAYKSKLRFPSGACTPGSIDPKRKAVCKMSLSGEIIEEYPSVYHAAKENGINSGRISVICNNDKMLIAKGFTYKFKY